MPTTATPPFVPAGRPAGIGAGLFGGSPYPIDPTIQQGLMRDAWRQFGIQLLANSMNPNIGQGLAAALSAGRQAYTGGAEQDYQVGRQREQDEQQRQYYEARDEYRRAQAKAAEEKTQAGAEEAKARAAQVDEALASLREKDPKVAQSIDTAIKLFGINGLPASMAALLVEQRPKQREPVYRSAAGTVYQIDPADGRATLVPGMPSPRVPGEGASKASAPPDGLSASRLSTRLGQLIDGLTRQYAAQVQNAEIDKMPPYHRIRSEAEQRLAQESAAVGRAGGGPPAPQPATPAGPAAPPAASPEEVVQAAGIPAALLDNSGNRQYVAELILKLGVEGAIEQLRREAGGQ